MFRNINLSTSKRHSPSASSIVAADPVVYIEHASASIRLRGSSDRLYSSPDKLSRLSIILRLPPVSLQQWGPTWSLMIADGSTDNTDILFWDTEYISNNLVSSPKGIEGYKCLTRLSQSATKQSCMGGSFLQCTPYIWSANQKKILQIAYGTHKSQRGAVIYAWCRCKWLELDKMRLMVNETSDKTKLLAAE